MGESKQPKIQQNKTTLVQLPLTTLGQETRWAYSTMLPSPHGAIIFNQYRQVNKQVARASQTRILSAYGIHNVHIHIHIYYYRTLIGSHTTCIDVVSRCHRRNAPMTNWPEVIKWSKSCFATFWLGHSGTAAGSVDEWLACWTPAHPLVMAAYRRVYDSRHLQAVVPSVLWRCWLGGRKGIRPVKNWRGYLSGARCRLA